MHSSRTVDCRRKHAQLGELLVVFHAHPWEDFHDHHRSPKGVELEEVVHQCC